MAPSVPPVKGGRWKAFALALAVHLLLVALLVVGIRWKTSPPPALQAELFTPAVVPPPPAPTPTPPPPVPVPVPKPVPPVVTPELPKPDIVTEQVRRAKLEAERREAEKREAAKREQEARRKAEELAKKKAEEITKKKAEEIAGKKASEDKRKAEELSRKEVAVKAAKDKEERARLEAEEKAARAAEAQRDAYLKGLMSKAAAPGGTSASGGPSGTRAGVGAGVPGGTDSAYRTRLSALIREKTVFAIPADVQGNPKAVFVVSVLPDCTIASVRLRTPSGVSAWDQAAERGIQRSSPLPRMPDGTCPPELEITRGPRDLN